MDRPQKSKTVIALGLLTIVGGIMVITGWIFNVPALQSIFSGAAAIKFNAGLCFILFGAALFIPPRQTGKYGTSLFFLLTLAGTIIGLLTLLQTLFHFNTGFDQFFINDKTPIAPDFLFPGRMAFNSAVNFSLLGLGFLLLSAKKRVFSVASQYIFHLVTLMSAIGLIGFLYGVSLFHALFYITAMPVQTAVLFLILSLAASLLNPSLGIARLFTGKLVGNQMARRLFTLFIVMIVIFGSLRNETGHTHLFSSLDIGMSVLAICFLLVSLLLIWNTAKWLNRVDRQRAEAENSIKFMNAELEKRVQERSAEFKKSEEKYHSLIEQASDAIYVLDLNGNFTDVNDSMCRMTGYTRAELLQLNTASIIDAEELKTDPLPKNFGQVGQIVRERSFIRKNGHAFTVELNIKMFADDRIMVIARDITNRKKMETELREAELKFRTIAEKSMVGVYIVQNDVFVYVNPRFTGIFGYEPAELLYDPLAGQKIFHESYHHIVNENIRLRISGEVESLHYEAMGVKKDGAITWVEIYGNRVIIGGKPAIIGSMIDITERKKAEEELRSSEKKYKLLFESNPSPLWMIAKDNMSIIAVNEAAASLYGYTKDELLNMSVKAFIPAEDSQQQLDRYIKEASGKNDLGIIRHVKKDGSIMFVQIIAHDIIFEGRPVRLSLTNDVTEKLKAEELVQKSEANLQAILKTTDTIYALFDQDLKVLTFNQKAIEFIKEQYNHVPEKGDHLADYFPEDKFPELNNFVKDVLKGHNINYEADYPQPDGTVLWYYVRLFPITNDHKEILGMLMALYDITERKNAEQDLKSAYGRIQSHINSIKDMAWKQSHLIRSPLANLKGLAAILKNGVQDPDHKVIDYIQDELDRMDAIIIEMAAEAADHHHPIE